MTGVYVNGGRLYASTWGGLGISTDGGVTFTNDTTENCLGDDFVLGTFVSGGIIYVATGGGLSISNGLGAGCPTSTLADTGISTPTSSLAAIGIGLFAILLGCVGLRRRS